MKKLLVLLLIVSMLVPTAFAESEKKTVTVWCWDPAFNIYAMQEAAKIYETINPDVTINIEEVSSDDTQTLMITAFQAGDYSATPDIVLMQDNSGQEFLTLYPTEFVALDDYINYDDFAAYKVGNFEKDGKHYAIPFDNGAAAWFYRADVLSEAGYTAEDLTDITWDRLIEIGTDVKQKTGKCLLATNGYGDFVMMMTQSMGMWFFDEDGDPQLDDEVFEEILEQCVRLVQSGCVELQADWNSYIAAFNSGDVLGTINGCWIMASVVLAEDQSGKWAMTCLPHLDLEGASNYSNQGGSSWLVLSSSDVQEEAIDFLANTFAGSVELYNTILPTSSAITTYLPASGAENYEMEHPFFGGQKVFAELVDYASKVPAVDYGVYNYDARDAMSAAMENVINGMDVEEALETAQATVEQLMQD